MVWEKRMSNAMGGKSARPCDNCIKRRARWYCAADDAFLCQSCDSSVHSANPLARRHERVRLNTPSLSPPTWHTRKPRTPRQKPKSLSSNSNPNPLHMVPEYSTDANDHDHDDHLLLYRVPVLCDDFAADVDSLFGDNPLPFDMEGLGLGLGLMMDSDVQINSNSNPNPNYMVKIEEEIGEVGMDDEIGFQLDFEYEEEDAKVKGEADVTDCGKTTPFLNLDHESVLSAWGHHKSPWTSGHRPNFDSDQLCPASFEGMGMGMGIGHGEMSRMLGDGGREAKVSRYREKRRTRLFAKKIRYEVRKLNAEKRPRMKGRFVKRPVFTNMLAY